LWSEFEKKVREQDTEPAKVCSKPETVVTGFVSLIEQGADSAKQLMTVEIEGRQWFGAAVSKVRVHSAAELRTTHWTLTYFATDGFMFPANLWEEMKQPIRIFAEVVPVSVSTEVGEKSCFLKARCAAHLARV
jgi:hypothetical protein